LTHHLAQRRAGRFAGKRGEPSSGLDGSKLAGIANSDHLRARVFSVRD
jgi:hypothetical protein